ncbi:PqqD family protein [Clostridium bornimense]|uniref:PqqD family protein n=1 Tax=Clostridium bornimense TaxID=1216932 RepID=UPI001C0FA7CA|nr:PqqD family protein [Clostridium bornimense]MBU5317594.1 PqqD family protein [Clostridium bornimense]
MKVKMNNFKVPVILRIDEERQGVMYIDERGMFNVNEIGVEILLGLNENKSLESIYHELKVEYDIESKILKNDINEFIKQLVDLELINEKR